MKKYTVSEQESDFPGKTRVVIEHLPAGDPYPNARNAVAFHEEPGFAQLEFWRTMRECDRSVDDVLAIFRRTLKRYRPDLLKEIETLDFRRYVAAKLGMM